MADKGKIPQWQSHKRLWGDEIVVSGRAADNPTDKVWGLACGETIHVSKELSGRVPEGVDPVGGYYCLCANGRESWSPAEVFLEDNTRVEDLGPPRMTAGAGHQTPARVRFLKTWPEFFDATVAG